MPLRKTTKAQAENGFCLAMSEEMIRRNSKIARCIQRLLPLQVFQNSDAISIHPAFSFHLRTFS
jgi:hypothetical protein